MNANPINSFIRKNMEFEQSKNIIQKWKEENGIVYNPEEIYSRNQEFVSVVGAYSAFDTNLLMQNLLNHIEDNSKAGGQFTISAFTTPIDKHINHMERENGSVRFKIYPKSEDILWAANADACLRRSSRAGVTLCLMQVAEHCSLSGIARAIPLQLFAMLPPRLRQRAAGEYELPIVLGIHERHERLFLEPVDANDPVQAVVHRDARQSKLLRPLVLLGIFERQNLKLGRAAHRVSGPAPGLVAFLEFAPPGDRRDLAETQVPLKRQSDALGVDPILDR